MDPYSITPHISYSVHRKCTSKWIIPSRKIKDHEFVLIEKGEGRIIIEGQEYSAKRGMLFYFYPGLLHSLESDPGNPFAFYAVHFSYSSVRYSDNEWKVQPGSTKIPMKFVQQIGSYNMAVETMKKLNKYWNERLLGFELICRSLFQQLLFCILDEARSNNLNPSSRLKMDILLKYIHDNLNEKILLNELADIVSLSSDYLTQIFKVYTGYTPIKYINQCKIDAAKSLMVEGDKKIKEIAHIMGFDDELYFSRVFRKIEGISPRGFLEKSTSKLEK